MGRFVGWLTVLIGVGALVYSVWLIDGNSQMQTWGFGMLAGSLPSIMFMQGMRVLDRHPKKKKVVVK